MCWGRACGGTDRGVGDTRISLLVAGGRSGLIPAQLGLRPQTGAHEPCQPAPPYGKYANVPHPLSVPPHYVVRPRPLPTPQNSCMIGKKEPYRLKQPGSTHGLRPRCFPPVVHHNQLCRIREIRVSGFSRTVCVWSGQARLVRSRRTLPVKRPNTRFPNPAERPL